MKKNTKVMVSASDVASVVFCPHSLELKHKGVPPSKEAVVLREQGNQYHTLSNIQASKKHCYVASFLYGIDDPRTVLLRTLRDQYLIDHWFGRLLIGTYYKTSPTLVLISLKYPFIEKVVRWMVDLIVSQIWRHSDNE